MKSTFASVLVLIAIVLAVSACNLFSFIGTEQTVSVPAQPEVVFTSGPIIAESPTPAPLDRPLTIIGTVTGTVDDCAFDGICALLVETNDAITYTVIYAPGMLRCEGTYDGTASFGDIVEVYGELTETTTISICTTSDYFINVLESASGSISFTGTVTGTVDDCAFDGICALLVESDGITYTAIYAPGFTPDPCLGTYIQGSVVGDTVEVYASFTDTNTLSICDSADYYIRPAQ